MKKSILAFTPISASMVKRLEQDFEVIVPDPDQPGSDVMFNDALCRAHGLIGVDRKLDRALLQRAAKLEVISSVSVGYNNYDLDYLNERGIMLTNTPDVVTESTADLGFGLIISCARRIPELDAWTKAGRWQKPVTPSEFASDVHGRTLGVVGMGNIGAAIARRARLGFRMQIIYSGNTRKPAVEKELDAEYRSLEQLLAEADFVCLTVPLTDKTRRLISHEQLALMKPSAYLINISRGPVVDEAALDLALREGRIRGAGLDVFEHEPLRESPLFQLPNVVTLPHVGAATFETRAAMGNRAIDNLRAALLGQRPQDLVNPQTWDKRADRHRE